MQTNFDLNKKGLRLHKLQHTSNGYYRLVLCLSLAGVLVMLGSCLVSYSVILSAEIGSGCTALALDAACQPLSRPTAVPFHTVFVHAQATPTIKATSKASLKSATGASAVPTHTAIPIITLLSDKEVVRNDVVDYEEYVMVEGAYRKAYNLLSVDVRDQEPYEKFMNDSEYTLPKGCWSAGQVSVSLRGSHIWDAWVPLTKVSCVDGSPMVYYSWHFVVKLGEGAPEIVSVGLYPTGVGNQ